MNKENRITIRLDTKLLNKIDKQMKRYNFDNRSECVRWLIENSLENI